MDYKVNENINSKTFYENKNTSFKLNDTILPRPKIKIKELHQYKTVKNCLKFTMDTIPKDENIANEIGISLGAVFSPFSTV